NQQHRGHRQLYAQHREQRGNVNGDHTDCPPVAGSPKLPGGACRPRAAGFWSSRCGLGRPAYRLGLRCRAGWEESLQFGLSEPGRAGQHSGIYRYLRPPRRGSGNYVSAFLRVEKQSTWRWSRVDGVGAVYTTWYFVVAQQAFEATVMIRVITIDREYGSGAAVIA